MWQTWWSISSDRWLMSKITSTQLCKRLWASAGLVSCFHVPSAYSGHCSTKATRPLPPPPFTLKPLPTSGASVGPREEITTTEWFIWAALRHQSATVFLVEMQRRVWKVTKLGHMIWGRGGGDGTQKVYAHHVFAQRRSCCRESESQQRVNRTCKQLASI